MLNVEYLGNIGNQREGLHRPEVETILLFLADSFLGICRHVWGDINICRSKMGPSRNTFYVTCFVS